MTLGEVKIGDGYSGKYCNIEVDIAKLRILRWIYCNAHPWNWEWAFTRPCRLHGLCSGMHKFVETFFLRKFTENIVNEFSDFFTDIYINLFLKKLFCIYLHKPCITFLHSFTEVLGKLSKNLLTFVSLSISISLSILISPFFQSLGDTFL